MIYLFDKHKKLKGTVRARHTIALLYERERNGIYSVSAEIPVSLTDKRTVYNYHKKVKGSDFIGHYDREGRFQLHKIAAVDIENTSIFIKGIHLFFDEAKAGAIIRERRFRGREIIDGAREAFDPIGWSVVDFDNSDQKNYSFYNVSPLEARAILVETFGYEFDYWLDFDGKNLRNKQIAVKKKIGKETNKRYNYGHNVLSIKVEQDYSEIYTAVIGRGKGEDLDDSDGYGRRIEFTDIEWKKPTNPMDKARGSRTLIDPNATQLFGYHDGDTVAPRTKVEIFSDIEDESELLQASYEWLMDNNVPKAVFSLNVPDGDGLDLGDSVHVIYRDIDLIKSTRVTKVIDDLVSGNRSVEFGDTAYFETDRRISGLKTELKRVGGSTSSRITRLKEEFDRRFDAEVQQWKDDFEQAVIDAEAEVEAMRAEMEEEFATVRKDMTERFESEKAEAYEEAQKNYDAIADRITNVVDSTREEMATAFEESVKESKEFAKEEAEAKAQEVQSNLETFEAEHSQIISDFEESVSSSFQSVNSEVLGLTTRLGVLGESLEDVEGTLTNTRTQLETQLTDAREDLEKSITDARTELEQSISSTRTELENKIDATENALNEVGEDLGNAKTDLQNQLDEARAELEGLEVGGRNLIVNSDDLKIASSNANVTVSKVTDGIFNNVFKSETKVAGASSYFTTIFGQVSEYPKVGQQATLSLLIRGTVFEGRPNGLDIYYNSGTKNQTMSGISEEYQWLSVTFDVHSESPRFHFYPPNFSELYIARAKLEIGNVATDWSPAPEDTEQKITSINQTITNIEGELSTKVEQTEVDALKGTVTTQGTLLTQTADEVSSKAEKSVVDTLTGRVSNTESSVTQNAAEIAKKLTKSDYDEDKKDTDAKITQWSNTATETAEGLTRVIGRVSETEKGVDAAQTRIEAEAGRIDGVLSRTSKVEGQVQDAQLAIEANADGLALRATKTEVEQAIDGIEVGGRNYLLNSKDIYFRGSDRPYTREVLHENQISKLIYVDDSSAISSYEFIQGYFSDKELVNLHGQSINLSVSVKTDSNGFRLGLDSRNSNHGNLVAAKRYEIKDTKGKWKRVGVTLIFPDDGLERTRVLASFSGNSELKLGDELLYKDFKLSIGNKILDWTPAPEDIDASISEVTDRVTTAEAELVVQAGEISQRATQSELDRVTGRVSTAETSIIQNADEIARRLVKSDYDSDKQATDAEITKWSNLTTETAEGLEQTISRVSTAEGKLSDAELSIKANADSLKLTATKTEVENAIDGIEVGGRNYLTVPKDGTYDNTHRSLRIVDGVMYWTQKSTATAGHVITSYAPDTTGTYTFSFKTDNDENVRRFVNNPKSGTRTATLNISKQGENFLVSLTYKNFNPNASIGFYGGEPFEPIQEVKFWDFKLEKGTVATDWTPAPEDTESKITKAQADILVNANDIALRATKTELNSVTGRVSTAESKLSVQADEISSVVGKVDGNTTNISSVLQDTKSIKSTIATIEKDLASQGSELDQALDSITGKVWLGDVGGRNLLPRTVFPDDSNAWVSRGTDVNAYTTTTKGLTDFLWVNRLGGAGNRYMAVLSPLLSENVVEGHDYTIQFKTAHRVNINEKFSYVYLMNEDGTVNQATFDSQQTVIEIGANGYDGKPIQLHTISVKANFSGRARILIGTHTVGSGDARFYVKEPKIEKGSATAYSRAPEDFLQMSELKITPEYWQLGSTRIDGDSVSSVLRGSPDSIDAIVSEMNLTGNLNVKGQIESIAMSAVRGDFAELFAKQVEANVISVDHISGRTAWFERLYILSTNVNRLTAQHVFTDAIHAKSLDAIEANIGRVRTAFLKANVINGDHISSNTIEIKHLTGYDAILEMLMARSVFSNNVTTLSLNAVEANIGSIRSKILTSDVILATNIKASTTLIDKIFSTEAMFERMMSKSAFVKTLNTVSIDTDQLTIRRADGGVLISNGTQRFGSPIITKPFPGSGVTWDGTNYVSSQRSVRTFERAYGEHSGRWANFNIRYGLRSDSDDASSKIAIVIRPGTMPSGVSVGTHIEEVTAFRASKNNVVINVRLPVPTFGAMSWTLEFYRIGDNSPNYVEVRSDRCWVSA